MKVAGNGSRRLLFLFTKGGNQVSGEICGLSMLTLEQQELAIKYVQACATNDKEEQKLLDEILINNHGIYMGFCDGEWSFIYG